jgi:glyoxylase-like metal-dependent hydrolase (beta-lactamase superfamily II)
MAFWICATCGVETERRTEVCPICADERQYLPPGGQRWTTLEELASAPAHLEVREMEPGLFGIHREPGYAINQWSFLVQTPQGNLLWDPPNYLDEDMLERVRQLGGVTAIAASHPHMFGTQVAWSHAFDSVPVWVNAANEPWLQRRDPVIQTWTGSLEVLPGVQLIQCGGHFKGSAVAHWADDHQNSGVLLAGDTIGGAPANGWVNFMRSYPNRIPLSPAVVDRIIQRLEPYPYDRLYTLLGYHIDRDAKAAVRRSAERQNAWVRGDFDQNT